MAMLNITYNTHPSGGEFPWQDLIELIPHLLWAGLLLAIFVWVGPSQLRALLLRASKIKVGDLEIEIGSQLEIVAASKKTDLSPVTRDQLAARLLRAEALFAKCRILWVDDVPGNNQPEARLLTRMGAAIDLARSTDEASIRLNGAVYDIVLSDMKRGAASDAGLEIIPLAAGAVAEPALIYYVGRKAGAAPEGSFGLTSDPSELFHLLIDVLERRKS